MRFGIITDIHFAAGRDEKYLQECTSGWRNDGVNFAMQLGDLVRGENVDEARTELKRATSILGTFRGTIRHVVGNHCLAVPEQELMQELGLDSPYYSFVVKDFRFIVLYGMDVSIHRKPETPEDAGMLGYYLDRPELHDYCGAIGKQQKAWLQEALEKAERSGEKVIIICHFPLLQETTDAKHGLLWNHREIYDILSSSAAVKACLGGHYHHGGYAVEKGIHFIVLPAFVNHSEHPSFCSGSVELERSKMVIRNQHHDILYELALR
ncbi:MAG: metallophosphoesterase [Chlorobiaceae bacterium]|nr:metallophosphoesterase [Chlorobiaceae bacterium]